jgi:hypothetical protein
MLRARGVAGRKEDCKREKGQGSASEGLRSLLVFLGASWGLRLPGASRDLLKLPGAS